jgi:hypothetical protein
MTGRSGTIGIDRGEQRGVLARLLGSPGRVVLGLGLLGRDLHHLAVAPDNERQAEPLVFGDDLPHRLTQGLECFFV